MNKHCRSYLLISLLAASLIACSTKPKPPALSPYLYEVKEVELEALRAYQLGNYQQAQRLHKRAYQAYFNIDHRKGMARQSINIAQVSLLIGDVNTVEESLASLRNTLTFMQDQALQNRRYLLTANLAIQQKDWLEAKNQLEQIVNPNSELKETISVNRAIIEFNQDDSHRISESMVSEMQSPFNRARLLRLLARQQLRQGQFDDAHSYLEQAKNLYREAQYAPGIAATLAIEGDYFAAIGDKEKSQRSQQRAQTLFKKLSIQR